MWFHQNDLSSEEIAQHPHRRIRGRADRASQRSRLRSERSRPQCTIHCVWAGLRQDAYQKEASEVLTTACSHARHAAYAALGLVSHRPPVRGRPASARSSAKLASASSAPACDSCGRSWGDTDWYPPSAQALSRRRNSRIKRKLRRDRPRMAFVSDASNTGSKPSEVMRYKQSGVRKSISGAEIGKRELVCDHDVCRMFAPKERGSPLTEADEETAV